jgi:hypothetical protein
MQTKMKKVYRIKVWGESESDLRPAQPESIEPLLRSQDEKNSSGLKFKIVSKQVEMFLNAGEVEKATEALGAYIGMTSKGYQAPVNRFARDHQNGRCPYMGANAFFGAFRDAADYLYPQFFYQKGKKGMTTNPSKKHLRKCVQIKPIHIFLYDQNGERIERPDDPEGQQPIGDVKGFAYYELIKHPYSFSYQVYINPLTKLFREYLQDPDRVVETIKQSAWHGIGGSRGLLYGLWKPTKIEVDA